MLTNDAGLVGALYHEISEIVQVGKYLDEGPIVGRDLLNLLESKAVSVNALPSGGDIHVFAAFNEIDIVDWFKKAGLSARDGTL